MPTTDIRMPMRKVVISLLQSNASHFHFFLTEEDGGRFLELGGTFGREETASSSLGAAGIHLGMTFQIVLQAAGHVFALGYDADVRWSELADFFHQQRIVRAAKDEGIDGRVLLQQLADVLLYEVVGTFGMVFIVFHQRNPHGTSFAGDRYIREEFVDFHQIGFGLDGARCGKYTDVVGFRELPDAFGGRTYHTQHPAGRVDDGEIGLLDGTESLGGCGVTGQDDQGATQFEEFLDGL